MEDNVCVFLDFFSTKGLLVSSIWGHFYLEYYSKYCLIYLYPGLHFKWQFKCFHPRFPFKCFCSNTQTKRHLNGERKIITSQTNLFWPIGYNFGGILNSSKNFGPFPSSDQPLSLTISPHHATILQKSKSWPDDMWAFFWPRICECVFFFLIFKNVWFVFEIEWLAFIRVNFQLTSIHRKWLLKYCTCLNLCKNSLQSTNNKVTSPLIIKIMLISLSLRSICVMYVNESCQKPFRHFLLAEVRSFTRNFWTSGSNRPPKEVPNTVLY